jgi:hypothetical protein
VTRGEKEPTASRWAKDISVGIGGAAEFRISGPFYFRVGSAYLHINHIDSSKFEDRMTFEQ